MECIKHKKTPTHPARYDSTDVILKVGSLCVLAVWSAAQFMGPTCTFQPHELVSNCSVVLYPINHFEFDGTTGG